MAKGVTEKANIYYTHFGADIEYMRHPEASHSMLTDLPHHQDILARKIVPPNHFRSPWISNCGFDLAGQMFRHVLPKLTGHELNPRSLNWKDHGKLIKFD